MPQFKQPELAQFADPKSIFRYDEWVNSKTASACRKMLVGIRTELPSGNKIEQILVPANSVAQRK